MTTAGGQRFDDIYFIQRNGLRLYGRRYAAEGGTSPGRRPVLCLAGLTRNSRDFHELALALSSGPVGRHVYTLDTRGRGQSEYDSDWRNYVVPIEMHDVIDFMQMQALADCGIVGTSRGGLITMLLAAAQPGLLGPVVLNDIGPVIETKGLGRIASYVGRTPVPRDWAEALKLVRELFGRSFPEVSDTEWAAVARQLFNEKNGRPAPGYDPSLGRAMSVLDGPIPAIWPQFDALARNPVLVIRGENSDLLSPETVAEMQRRHPALTSIVVPAEGHAPLLRDAPTITAVAEFFRATDGGHRGGWA
ncbi:MAG: alpha/beta hydrolase [Hyphomicrobium sp.]|nr:alpha/beta hydrolase [Hyphomicrobium sp.]